MKILTRRFALREYRPSDCEQFLAYQADPAFTLFHEDAELGDDNALKVFQLFLDWQRQTPRLNVQLAIAMRDDEAQLIGSCGVRMEGCAEGEAVFGVELARPYWGRYRYAEEVCAALIDWAFAEWKLSALLADTAFENAAVARLAQATGFVRTHADDKQWWRLGRADWEQKRKTP